MIRLVRAERCTPGKCRSKMAASNYERMMEIINEVFATRNDPDQLQVTRDDVKRLQAIHPATLSEYNEGEGPIVWLLIIPTTNEIMEKFLRGEISENQVLQRTKPGEKYDAIYLCSATTLPEYRGKGITTRIALEAIDAIRKDHPITSLFVWPFTEQGKHLAEKLAAKTGLTLRARKH